MTEPLRLVPGNMPDGGKPKSPFFPAQDTTGGSGAPDTSHVDSREMARDILSRARDVPASVRQPEERRGYSGLPALPVASLTPSPDEGGSDVSVPRTAAGDSTAQPDGGVRRNKPPGGPPEPPTPIPGEASPSDPEGHTEGEGPFVVADGIRAKYEDKATATARDMKRRLEEIEALDVYPERKAELEEKARADATAERSLALRRAQDAELGLVDESKLFDGIVGTELPDDDLDAPTDTSREVELIPGEFLIKGASQAELKTNLEEGLSSINYEFEGNLDKATELVGAFLEGMSYVNNIFEEKGYSVEQASVIVINNPSYNSMGFYADRNIVYLNVAGLQQFSQYPLDEMITLTMSDGVIGHTGTLRGFYQVGGVEEAHHNIFIRSKGIPESLVQAGDVSTAQYDAQDHEYHALRWSLRYAQVQNMGEATIAFLRSRLNAAKEIRKGQS